MSHFSESFITLLSVFLICNSVSAFESFQQKEQIVKTQNDVQIDSTASELGAYTKTLNGSDITTDSNMNFKLTDNTVLDRSYNTENASFGIDSYYNINLGFGASATIFKTDELKFKLNSIIDQNSDSGIRSSSISMDWEQTQDTKFGYSFSIAHTGKSYNPTLEYTMRKGVLALNKKLTYGWNASETSLTKRHVFHISNSAVWNYSGSLIENNFSKLDWVVETKSENNLKVSLFNEYNNVGGSFTILRDIEVPKGKYSDKGITFGYKMGKPKYLKTSFELTARSLFNAKGYSFSVDPSWQISHNLSLNTGLNLHHYRFDSNETLRLVLPFVKSNYTLGPKLSIDLFSQYNTETVRLSLNSNIKFALKEGHRLDLAYHRNNIVEVANPFLKTLADNSNMIFLKYTYSFAN